MLPKRHLSGTVVPSSPEQRLIGFTQGQECSWVYEDKYSSYRYLAVGSQVIIKNNSDDILAIGKFIQGKAEPFQGTLYCFMEFSIPEVPDSTIYSISLGDKSFLISKDDLERNNWNIDLTIK
jgi:hypothetical protein